MKCLRDKTQDIKVLNLMISGEIAALMSCFSASQRRDLTKISFFFNLLITF